MDYKQKYLKYKNKYLDLKGGMRSRGAINMRSRTRRRSSNNSNSSSDYSSDAEASNLKVYFILKTLKQDGLTQMDEETYKMLKGTFPSEYIMKILEKFIFNDSKMTGDLFLYKIYLDLIGLVKKGDKFEQRNKDNNKLLDEQKYMKNLKDNFTTFDDNITTFLSLDDKLYNKLKDYIKPSEPSEPSTDIDYDKIIKQALFNLIMVFDDYNSNYISKFNVFKHEYFKDFDSYFKFIKNFMKLIIELDNKKNSNDENNKLLTEFTDYLINNDEEIIDNNVYKIILNTEEYDPNKKTLFIYIIKTRNINYFKYFYKEFVLHIFNKDILNDKEKINCIENIIYHLRIINHHENNENIVKMFEYMYMETQYQEEIINTIIRNNATEPFLKKILELHEKEGKKIDNPVHYLINVHKDNFNQYFNNFKGSFNNNDIIKIKNKNILVHILKFDDKDILKNFLAFMKDKLTEDIDIKGKKVNEFHHYLFEKDIEEGNAFDYCTKKNLNNSRQELNKFSSTGERLGNYLFKNGGSQEYESF